MYERRRNLRKTLTPAEVKLWKVVRSRRFYGYRFHRQHQIGPYIVDFVCLMRKVIIELDGGYHREKDQAEYDTIRDIFLTAKGYKVFRFWNLDIFERFEVVLKVILENLIKDNPSSACGRRCPEGADEGINTHDP